MEDFIGIDVAKSTLQVYLPRGDLDFEIENSPKGLKQLLAKLKKHYGKDQNAVWIYEPTGSYSATLTRFCHVHQIRCFIVKPSQSAAFAKSLKSRNKTDKADARMLSQMHTLAKPDQIAVPAYDEALFSLQSHLRYYKGLVKERVIKTNQLEAALHRGDDPFVLRRLRARIRLLRQEEKELAEAIAVIIRSHPPYRERYEAIVSLKGIGPVAGAVLFELFMRHPDASQKEITALCGLDPIEVSSGSSIRRKSKISKQGSRLVRSSLFMGVLGAIRYNPDMKAFYKRLKSNGKHSTVAQIAVMRKMVGIAFTLFKNKAQWEPRIGGDHQQGEVLAA